MSYSHDNRAEGKTDTGKTQNPINNPPTYQPQPRQQMRNEYGRHLNTNEFHGPQRHMNLHGQGEEVPSYQRKPGFGGLNKGGNFNPYYRPEATRYNHNVNQQVVERRTDAQPNEDARSSNDNIKYSFPSRDGPSPGRSYGYGMPPEEMQAQERRASEITKANNRNHPFRSPIPPPSNNSRSKRKAHNLDPSTPDGPRLISNQSSDDSINALLPSNKRARLGSLFPSESASFFKSFTLSPMNSRTFSREDVVDIPRFASSRGSAEGNRIFHSWSSGNSRSENHSPSDVRNCYDDWHSASFSGRRGSFNSIGNRPGESKSTDHESGNPPTTHPGRYDSRSLGPPQPQSWQNNREAMRTNGIFDVQKLDRAFPSNSRQLQPLHPEDRYNDQLLQGYTQGMEMGRPYWNNPGQGPPIPQLYTSQRRDDLEDRHNNQAIRAQRPNSSTRVSAPTPPVTNGAGRYGYEYHHGMYDSARGNVHPHIDNNWGPPNARGRHFEDSFAQNMHMKTSKVSASYTNALKHLKSVTIETGEKGAIGMRTGDGILLLAMPEDRISLSETLCIVRENVEVFVATETDVKAPAPGRKRPVLEGQVGLRCIHCRAAVHQSEKVKRAVCFPSSMKRIYRTVIDMKLDHFKACRFVPVELKLKLEELKATNARSTGTTMQYFLQAAKRMSMQDTGHGIRFGRPVKSPPVNIGRSLQPKQQRLPQHPLNSESIIRHQPLSLHEQQQQPQPVVQQGVQPGVSFSLSLDLSISGDSNSDPSKAKSSKENQTNIDTKKGGSSKYFSGKISLAIPEDKSALSTLRCFLRENVCAFSATREDIAVRTPTTFSVVLGQVGIGCVHCLSLPARERSNRAVCFPFSIARIYQSVADIQRFHIGECKMVPSSVRARFHELQSASSKGSKGLATRQYWQTSAKKLGLVDTDCGIRFTRDPSVPLEKAKSLDILAQVASDVTTAAQPLVLPEDKPHIAEFLYDVMKQLQPCRFTEADRNKRRLKDVGCIGVECKHCAGQVDGRKFFWSSVNAVESNFVSVHTHMMECKMISQEMKDKLAHMKTLRKEQTTKLKSGSQKAFFARVWKRLHSEGNKIPSGGGSNQKRSNGKKELSSSPPEKSKGTAKNAPHAGLPPTVDLNQPIHSSPSPPISDFNPSGGVGSPSSVSTTGSFLVASPHKVKQELSPSQESISAPSFPSPQITSKIGESYAKEKTISSESLHSSFLTSPTFSPIGSPQIATANNITSINDPTEGKEDNIITRMEKI